jgi:hypothetical protein
METDTLVQQQRANERAQRRLAEGAVEPDEAAQHERRADKAHYLREKLEERARSEQDTDG